MDKADMDMLEERPSGEGEEGIELERKGGDLAKGETPVVEEEFVEGVTEDGFGLLPDEHDDELFMPVKRFTFTNKNGMTAQVIDFGITITSIRVPDKKGVFDDVVLGFDNLEAYVSNKAAYIGSTIGRVCNRVSRGCFLIGSQIYDVTKNVENSWQLHGGRKGFSFIIWKSHIQGKRVIFSHLSRDGEEGYPGNLLVQMEVWLTDDNGLKMVATATTDHATPVSITNHAYFNLAGHWAGPDKMGEHVIVVNADKYLEVDDNMIPTGEIKHVATTDLDLRIPRLLSRLIPVIPKGGFDHNYCVNGGKKDGVRFVARLIHPNTGRVMEVFSDQPCAVVFTARNLPFAGEMEEIPPEILSDRSRSDGSYEEGSRSRSEDADLEVVEGEEPHVPMRPREVTGKNGASYLKYGAVCVEPQGYPDAVNKPHFPPVLLYPGQTYTHTMVFKYSSLVRTKSIRKEAERNGPEIPLPEEAEQHDLTKRHSGDSRRSDRSGDRRSSGDVPTINHSRESQQDRRYDDPEPEYDVDY